MKIIFNKQKREELAKIANERGTSLKEEMARLRKEVNAKNKIERPNKKQKMLLARLHRFDAEKQLIAQHNTALVRFEKIVKDKVDGLNQFRKQIDLSEEEYIEAKEKIEKEYARQKSLELKRENRKAKLKKQKLKNKAKVSADLDAFLKAELKRKEKKALVKDKYIGLKQKKPARAITPEQLQKKESPEFKKYVFITEHIVKDPTTGIETISKNNVSGIKYCLAKDIAKRTRQIHDDALQNPIFGMNHIGVFVYENDRTDHCIFELVANGKLSINGQLTSHIANQRAAKKAA